MRVPRAEVRRAARSARPDVLPPRRRRDVPSRRRGGAPRDLGGGGVYARGGGGSPGRAPRRVETLEPVSRVRRGGIRRERRERCERFGGAGRRSRVPPLGSAASPRGPSPGARGVRRALGDGARDELRAVPRARVRRGGSGTRRARPGRTPRRDGDGVRARALRRPRALLRFRGDGRGGVLRVRPRRAARGGRAERRTVERRGRRETRRRRRVRRGSGRGRGLGRGRGRGRGEGTPKAPRRHPPRGRGLGGGAPREPRGGRARRDGVRRAARRRAMGGGERPRAPLAARRRGFELGDSF